MACLREDVRFQQVMHALLVAAQQAPTDGRPSNCELICAFFRGIGRPNDGCFHTHEVQDAPHECAGCGTAQHQFVESPDPRDGDDGAPFEDGDVYHEDDRHFPSPPATIATCTLPEPISPPAALPLSPSYVSPLLSDIDSDIEGPATPLDLDADLDAGLEVVYPVSPIATPLDLVLPPPTPSYTSMPRVMRVIDDEENEDQYMCPSPAPSLTSASASGSDESCPSPPSPRPVRGLRSRRHSPYRRPSKDKIQLDRKPKRDVGRAFEREVSLFVLDCFLVADLVYTPPVRAPEAFSTTRGGCDELFEYSSSSESESDSSASSTSSRASSPDVSHSPRFNPLSRAGRRVVQRSL
ncbi:hypothetical protein AURDEDRAFT_147059 [Auricularia subglabra TFB-10046 SS5]|uniref:Uncharacterized protein n=1 Tax=Auricularia subglabra (strain TFB-10046 / SS5) TaxID=717982 RepID=J0DAN3_AURST|nr:hypothetical protein AURDEDRAFT_147059 [Auricularia subglabra TFB-10046 SS5]